MRESPGPELMTEEEARATVAEILLDQARPGEAASRHRGAYLFAYRFFPGSERARELRIRS
jgi:hypothetical protein